MNIQDRMVEGFYVCEISVDSRCEKDTPRRLTNGALLTVEIPLVKDNIEYNRKYLNNLIKLSLQISLV